MTSRDPRPGDRVLIRATVAPPQNQSSDDDVFTVIVPTPLNPALVLITRDTVAEVLDPEWFPPQDRDVVLDAAGDVWQYAATSELWTSLIGISSRTTDALIDRFGPLVLVARGGKPVAS